MNCPSCGQENAGDVQFCMQCASRLAPSPGQVIPPERSQEAHNGFVGRHREMEELKAALEEAISGKGRLAMLVGEPGIGKTRTAQELASHGERSGVRVLWGRCYEEEGAPPKECRMLGLGLIQGY